METKLERPFKLAAWLGIGFAAAFWLVESFLHAFVFGREPFLEALLGADEMNELWMRFVIVALFVAFGAVAARFRKTERSSKEEAQRLGRLLQFASYVRAHAPLGARKSLPLPLDLAVSRDEIGELTRLLWDLSNFLEGRFRELYALLQLTHEINMGLLLDEVLGKAYGTLRSVLPYDRLSVALIEDDGRTVRARWAKSEAPRMMLQAGYQRTLEGSSLQAIIDGGEPRILNDLVAYLQEHPGSEATRLMVAEGIRSSLTCPLLSGGKPIGFMFFSSRRAGTYKDVHVEVFKLIAGHLSLVVEKSTLYQQVLREKEHSESLLLNVIPERVAARLRAREEPIAESFPAISILFADIVDFTSFASRYPPERVLHLLQDVFLLLDHLCDLHGVEKIKTVGDEYMAISSPSDAMDQGLRRLADFALDAMESVGKLRYPDGRRLSVRMGMHTGAAVAGVIGQKKFAYDIWGDAVNIASRMETTGEGGRIQVTAEVYEVLREGYLFDERGSLEVKGRGWMKVYFLIGRKLAAKVASFPTRPRLARREAS